ncbi:PEP/pyruvate-binding domain-containing protein [Draconibacterium halophilum]|uniref:Phosphoenolpyruvate synthase n=1 Tax=Draconibacterium halophilum TaxID=2706887 RepID=A0A6C0RAY2_9BACT|nr:PEP/pyruvate-binding domain-containing protein [Draconibacterium halophilum]QIA07249.1 pyruvate, phosphate dikinase [Draconibacterium halophilum]
MDIDNISLSTIYKKRKNDRDIFQELMPTKVKEVLLVATLYDSYSIVREGQFSDKIFGEYLQLNLYAAPRFTSVHNKEEAELILKHRDFDLIIVMAGMDKHTPVETARAIRNQRPSISMLLLVNNNADLRFFQNERRKLDFIDRIFVWNGNSNVFMAMIKYIEDKSNVARDTQNGSVRVILLVEDSIQYYSRYLPMLYTTVMTQTQVLVEEDAIDELHKILRMRARPKVILVDNYEEAVKFINSYRRYMLCVISDVKFEKNGVEDEDAGIELLQFTKNTRKFPIPLLLQSHDISNAKRAKSVGADFINKNSESLSMDIFNFLYRRLGFGDFIFKGLDGLPIAEAKNMEDFQEKFREIPEESLQYHGSRNSFSTWLMARGEINLAELLMPIQLSDFNSPEELRKFCLDSFKKVRFERLRGTIVNFDSEFVSSSRFIVRMAKGSLGGKGRGIAFICNFIENIDLAKFITEMNIRIPSTSVIGALEFDKFIETNNLYDDIYSFNDYSAIRKHFLESEFDDKIRKRLMEYLKKIKRPLAVRSSGLFEDSLLQPFSGVYATYLIPNNHTDLKVRYQQLETAIKLVYSSIFTESAQAYFDAVNYKIEEEKMAVVIQEVIGHEYNDKYYPTLSGVAQSYNYYPIAYMEPEDGFSVAAVGLGMYVVGGENSFRFCPKYPNLNASSLKDQLRDTQKQFYAIDLSNPDFDLVKDGEDAAIKKYRIKEAEKDGTLEHSASTYIIENDDLIPGIQGPGPKVVDFANILKYSHLPLADVLQLLLKLFKEAMGSPVEIEYAIDLEPAENGKPTLYLLQIKPLIRTEEQVEVDIEMVEDDKVFMYAEQGMGNGKIEEIRDVVYVDPDKFDKMKTKQMAQEISKLNEWFEKQDRPYILIGPGRWGSRDPYTGIPVLWAHISKARIIVEMGLPDFPLDASLGSHFFHNVTSMNVGYFSVPHHSRKTKLRMDALKNQQVLRETEFIKHVKFDKPLTILMNGRDRRALIHC